MNATETLCPVCGGTGWKEVGPDPKARQVARCDCAFAARVERLLVQSRIPDHYQRCEFANFSTEFQGADPSLRNALVFARGFVDHYPVEKRGLLFIGSAGVGKTHLAVATIKELMRKGIQCLFYDYRKLLKEIRSSYSTSIAEVDVLRPVLEVPVLLLDELGAERTSDWVWDTVSHIVTTRYNDNRTTVFTTNYPDGPCAEAAEAEDSERRFAAQSGAQQEIPDGSLAGVEGCGRKSVPQVSARDGYADSGKQSADGRGAGWATETPKGRREETIGDRITDRMRSRLHEMCYLVTLYGEDFRRRRVPRGGH